MPAAGAMDRVLPPAIVEKVAEMVRVSAGPSHAVILSLGTRNEGTTQLKMQIRSRAGPSSLESRSRMEWYTGGASKGVSFSFSPPPYNSMGEAKARFEDWIDRIWF